MMISIVKCYWEGLSSFLKTGGTRAGRCSLSRDAWCWVSENNNWITRSPNYPSLGSLQSISTRHSLGSLQSFSSSPLQSHSILWSTLHTPSFASLLLVEARSTAAAHTRLDSEWVSKSWKWKIFDSNRRDTPSSDIRTDFREIHPCYRRRKNELASFQRFKQSYAPLASWKDQSPYDDCSGPG